jgi:uncharacterized membrane protein YhaH (DUF805 family)
MIAVDNPGNPTQVGDPLVNFFSYRGRAGRGQYWIGLGIGLIALLGAVAALASMMNPTGSGSGILAIPCLMGFFWIHSLVTVKRLRDMALSPWYYLVFGVGPFVFLALTLEFIEYIGPVIAIGFFGLLGLPGLIPGKPAETTQPRP